MKKIFCKRGLTNQKGITLIELIIYMGIFSTLLMVLVQLFGSIVNVNLESQANSAVSQDGRFILNRVSYDLRQMVASSITLPAGFGAINSGSTLSFTTTGGKTYTYSLVTDPMNPGKDLQISDGVNTDRLNSYGTTVSNLTFTKLKSTASSNPKNTITISFTLTSTTVESGNRNKVGNFQTTIGTR